MSLESIVDRVKSGARAVADYFAVPNQTEAMRDYAIRRYFTDEQREQVFAGKTPEEQRALESRLEAHINESVDSQKKYIDAFSARLGRGAGLGALANDALHTYLNTPWTQFGYLQLALIGGKAILEAPSMLSYVRETRDYKGALEWLALKPISALVPILGPAIDVNSAPRIIKKRAIRDATSAFLKEVGAYTEQPSLSERLYTHVKEKAQPIFDTPMAYA